MRVTPQSPIEPAAVVTIDGDLVAPTAVHRRLFLPDALGADLLAAVDALDESRPWVLVDDLGLDPLYASSVGRVRRWSGEHERHYSPLRPPLGLLKLTRYLDKQPGNSLGEAVAAGPARVLAELEERPVVEVRLSAGIVDEAHREQITRLLGYLRRLTPGVDVRLTGSRIDLRRLLEKHGADLPADVRERAQTTLAQRPRARSPTAIASAAIEEIGTTSRQSGIWRTLWRLIEDPDPQLPQRRLETDSLLGVSESAVRRRVSALEDAGLVEAYHLGGKTLAPTEAGLTALTMIRDRAPSLVGGRPSDSPGNHSKPSYQNSDSLNHPPNRDSDSGTPPTREGGERGNRPTAEGLAASAGGSTSSSSTRSLAPHEAHRAAAAAPATGGVGLVDCRVDLPDDRTQSAAFVDEDGATVVGSIAADSRAGLMLVRSCDSLLSPLTADRLDGVPGKPRLSGLLGGGLVVPHVARKAPCLGGLCDNADGARYLARLHEWLGELKGELKLAAEHADDGYYDPEDLRQICRKALGLRTTLVHIWHFLGFDVVQEVRRTGSSDPETLADFAANCTSKTAVVDSILSAGRYQFEDRDHKRADTLRAPEVDARDPTGTLTESVVIAGRGASNVGAYLDEAAEAIEPASDGENYAPFILNCEIAVDDDRDSLERLVDRYLPYKNLEPTREALSLLRATVSTYDAAEALSRLGPADEEREIDRGDLRYGLSQIDATRLFPDLRGTTVSRVFQALLDEPGGLDSTAEVARSAGVTTQSIRDNRDVLDRLAAAGFLSIVEAGPGEATRWDFKFPASAEIGGEEPGSAGSIQGFMPAKPGSTTPITALTDAVAEALYYLTDELGRPPPVDLGGEAALSALTGPHEERDLGPLLEVAPDLRGLVALLARLLDAEGEVPASDRFGGSITLGEMPEAARHQATISTAAG